MRATITVNMDNAAFDGVNAGSELEEVLKGVIELVGSAPKHALEGYMANLRDSNGNIVGELKIKGR